MNNKKYVDKNVLLVDDDKLNLNIVSRFVGAFGVTLDTASGGQELIDKGSAKKYDLIITDEMMPEVSGTDAMKKLKALSNFTTPIVVLTGDIVDGAKEKYLNSGYDYYLSKPINRDELGIVMDKFIN